MDTSSTAPAATPAGFEQEIAAHVPTRAKTALNAAGALALLACLPIAIHYLPTLDFARMVYDALFGPNAGANLSAITPGSQFSVEFGHMLELGQPPIALVALTVGAAGAYLVYELATSCAILLGQKLAFATRCGTLYKVLFNVSWLGLCTGLSFGISQRFMELAFLFPAPDPSMQAARDVATALTLVAPFAIAPGMLAARMIVRRLPFDRVCYSLGRWCALVALSFILGIPAVALVVAALALGALGLSVAVGIPLLVLGLGLVRIAMPRHS